MSVVLVTGATGLLGVNVVKELLARDARVVVFDSRPDTRFLQVEQSSIAFADGGDILDLPAIIGAIRQFEVTHVVHLAAVMTAYQIRHPYMLAKVNLEGTLNVFEAARLSGVRRLVFGSTRGVIARTEGTPYGHPDYKPVPAGFVGPRIPLTILKVAAEQLGLSYARQGDLDFCALRFADFYGAERIAKSDRSQANVFNDVILNAYFGRETHIAQGADQIFEPLYIKDCATGIVQACFAENLATRIYQIGLGKGVLFGDAVETVRRAFPQASINVGAGLNFASFEKDPNYCVLDISTATTELGYQPKYTIESGIDDYIEVMDRYRNSGKI